MLLAVFLVDLETFLSTKGEAHESPPLTWTVALQIALAAELRS